MSKHNIIVGCKKWDPVTLGVLKGVEVTLKKPDGTTGNPHPLFTEGPKMFTLGTEQNEFNTMIIRLMDKGVTPRPLPLTGIFAVKISSNDFYKYTLSKVLYPAPDNTEAWEINFQEASSFSQEKEGKKDKEGEDLEDIKDPPTTNVTVGDDGDGG